MGLLSYFICCGMKSVTSTAYIEKHLNRKKAQEHIEKQVSHLLDALHNHSLKIKSETQLFDKAH